MEAINVKILNYSFIFLFQDSSTVPECGVPSRRELQPARPLRRCHGSWHRVRRHRPQGSARPHRTDDQRPRQLRSPGRPHRFRHGAHPAHRTHRAQSQGIPRSLRQSDRRQARRRHGQIRSHPRPGHHRRWWPQRERLPAVPHRPHRHARRRRRSGLHPVLVLVPSGTLPGLGFLPDLPDRPQRPPQDAQAGVPLQRQAVGVRLPGASGGEEAGGKGEGDDGRPEYRRPGEAPRSRSPRVQPDSALGRDGG